MCVSKKIGEFIKTKRKELRITQKELAKKLGYKSNSTIVQIEKGITSITIEQLQEFSKVLNFEISEVFEKVEGKKEWRCEWCENNSFLVISTQGAIFDEKGEIKNMFNNKETRIACSACFCTKNSIREIANFKKVEEK